MVRHRGKTLLYFFLISIVGTGLLMLGAPEESSASNEAMIIELEGPISPGTAMYVKRGLEQAKSRGAALAVIRLDTPGGLGSSMRTIVKAILNSPVPVAVWVGPRGAGAASAGVMVTVAGHIAAMAPGTNIGAAHPVTAGGKDIPKTMNEKVVNDMASYSRGIAEEKGRNGKWVEKAIRESVSITADEALKKKVIDLIAKDIDELIRLLDGREVALQAGKIKLKTADLKKVYYRPGFRDKVLQTISDPNIAYILMMIGLAGLYFELSHPGAIFPGVIGAISLILAFYSFQTLPVNYAGLILIILAIIFFIAEIKITSYGILSMGGLISLTLGSIMLFKAYWARPKGGAEGLLGEVGTVKEEIDPEGLVFVHGEYWRARAAGKLEPGERVEVESLDGLVLRVKKSDNKES